MEFEWNSADPVVWVTESATLRDRIYLDEVANLRWQDYYQHKAKMNLRLSQSGVRLVAWLNETVANE